MYTKLTVGSSSFTAGAKVKGLEFAIQKNFDQLPGWLNGLGAVFNYTYSDSTTDELDNEGRALPLEGLSQNSFNAIGFWENKNFSLQKKSKNYIFAHKYIIKKITAPINQER